MTIHVHSTQHRARNGLCRSARPQAYSYKVRTPQTGHSSCCGGALSCAVLQAALCAAQCARALAPGRAVLRDVAPAAPLDVQQLLRGAVKVVTPAAQGAGALRSRLMRRDTRCSPWPATSDLKLQTRKSSTSCRSCNAPNYVVLQTNDHPASVPSYPSSSLQYMKRSTAFSMLDSC